MPAVYYAVTATLPDLATRDEFVHWLRTGHVQDVLRGGAVRAEIIVLDPEADRLAVKAVYAFPDRTTFERYVAEHAPRLRAEGVAKFGSRPGVSFIRELGSHIEF